MAKTNQIQQLVNGEIADADDVNQIVENAGNEGGSIPYDATTHQRENDGSESLGNASYPWGDMCVDEDAYLREIDTVSHTEASSVIWRNLRKFISLKDTPDTYSGQEGKVPVVNDDEDALEFVNIIKVIPISTTTAPAVTNAPSGQTTTVTIDNSEDYTGKRIRLFGIVNAKHSSGSWLSVASTDGNRIEYTSATDTIEDDVYFDDTADGGYNRQASYFNFEGILTTSNSKIAESFDTGQGTQTSYLKLDGSGYITLVNEVTGTNVYGVCRIEYALLIVYE